jgi:hypothetical protein
VIPVTVLLSIYSDIEYEACLISIYGICVMTSIHNGHILIVDDEVTNRELLQCMLTKQGYEVSLASNGERALELISQRSFALVLLDIMMPEVDGISVLKGGTRTVFHGGVADNYGDCAGPG